MQLMIDILVESPESLRLTAQFMIDHARLIEVSRATSAGEFTSSVPAGTQAQSPPSLTTPPPPPIVPPAPSNVVPFPPPPPTPLPAPAAAPGAAHAVAPPVPVPNQPAPGVHGVPATNVQPVTNGAVELDRSGMPWDARIHQKLKAKKKDGTWKLQKGIDSALVAQVTQELHARMINSTPSVPEVPIIPGFPGVPVPPGSAAVHPSYPSGGMPIPPVPPAGSVPVPPPPVSSFPGASAMHMPQSPVLGVPDGNNQNVVQPSGQVTYRDLMMKIKRYTDAGWITREEVASLVQQAGAPSVQLLGSMAHLVVQVDTLLEAAVYDRQK